jgi:hypothetical protein
MERFEKIVLTIFGFFIAAPLAASVFTPISLVFDITKSNAAFIALIALFFIEAIWLRVISGSHILKVLFVVPCMNLASVAITAWGPYFIFENVITGKFTRYMVYVNFKDFMASKTAFMHGLVIVGIWVLINVAVEAMVVGLFYHQINKRSLIVMLIAMHLMSVGVAVIPELMKKYDIKEITIERAVPQPSEQLSKESKKTKQEKLEEEVQRAMDKK